MRLREGLLATLTVLFTTLAGSLHADTSLPAFVEATDGPINILVGPPTERSVEVFLELQRLTTGRNLISSEMPTEFESIDVAVFIVDEWPNATGLPLGWLLSDVFQQIANLPEEVPTANIRVEIDGQRQLGIIFLNETTLQGVPTSCWAQFALDVIERGFDDQNVSIWDCF